MKREKYGQYQLCVCVHECQEQDIPLVVHLGTHVNNNRDDRTRDPDDAARCFALHACCNVTTGIYDERHLNHLCVSNLCVLYTYIGSFEFVADDDANHLCEIYLPEAANECATFRYNQHHKSCCC